MASPAISRSAEKSEIAPRRPEISRIALVGDIMLGRLVSREMQNQAPERFWGNVGPLLRETDGVIANLECAITSFTKPWDRSWKRFHFRAEPRAIDILKAGNVRAVCLANNHSLDFRVEGLRETIQFLNRGGIAHAGAGETETDARAAALFELGHLKIGLFGITDNEPDFAAGFSFPGTAYVDLQRSPIAPTAQDIASVRALGAQTVIVSCHLGPNMVPRPGAAVRAYHLALADRGVDVIHGHSAHLVQAVERRHRSILLHDTGDFLDDYAVDPQLRNDWSFIFLLEIGREGLKRLTLVPVLLTFCEVNIASATERRAICDRMRLLAGEFGVHWEECDEGLTLNLADASPP